MKKNQTTAKPETPLAPEGPLLRIPELDYGVLDNLLGFALRRAQNALYLDFYRATAKYNISPQRFAALVLIAQNKKMRQAQLAQALGLHRSGALRLVDWLQERGWVERYDDPDDARSWGLVLSKTGKTVFKELSKIVQEHDVKFQSELGTRNGEFKMNLELIAQTGLAEFGK
ncbi:MAG: MarR family transcriptional regulator [Pseudomonadota bacterium]